MAPQPPEEILGDYALGPVDRERLVSLLRRVEREPALLGASPHLLAVGRRD